MVRVKYTVKTQAVGEAEEIKYEGYSFLDAYTIRDNYNNANKEMHGENFAWVEEKRLFGDC